MTMQATPAVSTVSPAVVSTLVPAVATTVVPGVGTTVSDGSTILTTTATDYPPSLAAAYHIAYISAMSSVSSRSAAAAAESKALKDQKHMMADELEEACNDVGQCERRVNKALKGKWPNAADNLQVQLTAVAVGFIALGGAFVLI